MPIFQYTAMDSQGKEKKGKMEAADESAVSKALKQQGMFPTNISPVKGDAKKKAKSGKGGSSGKKKGGISLDMNLGPVVIRPKDLMVFTRQLSILLDAGLPLVRSLRTLQSQAKNPSVKKILDETANSVEGGSTFSEALAQHPRSFNKLYLNMVKAGEAAGAMETILDRLATFMEKAAKMAGKVKSAMVYPIVVMTVAGIITTGLMVFIVPKFKKIFEDILEGEPLPGLTQFVTGVSVVMQEDYLYIILGVPGIIVLYKVINMIPIGHFIIDWIKFKMPLFGPIVSKSAIGRFSRTLGTLLHAGVPVLQALQIVKETSGNEVVAQGIQKVHEAVKEGQGMAGPLKATKIFPDMVISMIEVGEETGKLPEMLTKIADTYDEEVENAVEGLTSMIEPLMMVGMAVVIGTIVISLFLPLIAIMEKLGGS